jgi:hypothetical protein
MTTHLTILLDGSPPAIIWPGSGIQEPPALGRKLRSCLPAPPLAAGHPAHTWRASTTRCSWAPRFAAVGAAATAGLIGAKRSRGHDTQPFSAAEPATEIARPTTQKGDDMHNPTSIRP